MFDKKSIIKLAEDYFKLLNNGDIEIANRLFHEKCSLFNVVDGQISHVTFDEYANIIKNRESPLSRGEPVYGEIVSIDQSDANTATLKVLSAVQPKYFEDYLSLLRVGENWKIVAKVYRVIPNAK